jgi:hypothetical protein
MSDARWTLRISCPRPANRACDDWHVQPERVARIARDWFGKDAEITLTARTARLHTQGTGKPPTSLVHWQTRFATALDCLFMKVDRVRGECVLPRPVRTEIREEGEA